MKRARGAGPERLSAADASNVVLDVPDQVNAFLVAGILRPGGAVDPDGAVDLDAVRSAVSEWARLEPRLAQRVARSGRHLVWETVALEAGARVRVVDGVPGLPGLQDLCATLAVTPMRTDLPLWEVLLLPGLEPGRAGVVLRFHHALADGTAVVHLVGRLLGGERDPAALRVDSTGGGHAPAARPADQTHPQRTAMAGGASYRMLHRAWAGWGALVTGVVRTTAMLRGGTRRTALLGQLGTRRGVVFLRVPLAGLATATARCGATVNDGLLAAVTTALRPLVETMGEPVGELVASVPVALPRPGRSGNAVGVMIVPLPVGTADPLERVTRVAARTRVAKAEARRRGTMELTRTRWGSRVFLRLARHQRLVHLFVTNVPGPRSGLAVAGAPLESAWPVAAIQGNVRLGVAAASYEGVLHVTVHHDRAIPGGLFAERLEEELGRLATLGAPAR